MQTIPLYTAAIFVLASLLTIWFFYNASRRSIKTIVIVAVWVILQSALSLAGFYTNTEGSLPRFPLLIIPPFLFIVILFSTSRGKIFIDSLDTRWLTLLHTVRIPVEVGLVLLYLDKYVPRLMTFEGRNFDILAGLSALVIYYFVFVKKTASKKALLAWNFISLLLLLNIVINAILSIPTPIQQFGFDQPARALLYFPVTLLPCLIVPIVLLSHLAVIRQLAISSRRTKLVIN